MSYHNIMRNSIEEENKEEEEEGEEMNHEEAKKKDSTASTKSLPVVLEPKKKDLQFTCPQSIFEHLNGVIVGHYVMKKAISVSIFNHFDSCQATRETLRCEDPSSSDLEGDPPPPRRRSYTGEALDKIERMRRDSAGTVNMSPTTDGTFLTPIVARVIIEASTHKVHLRKSNTLTFDPTGSGLPLGVIGKTVAAYLNVPYFRCDCRNLVPSSRRDEEAKRLNEGRRKSIFDDAYNVGNTVSEVFASNLLGENGFSSSYSSLSQSIVFLDNMDKIGICADNTDQDNRQILRDLIELIDGTTLELSKPQIISTSPNKPPSPLLEKKERKPIKQEVRTQNMFFVCFGVSASSSINNSVEDSVESLVASLPKALADGKRRYSAAASTTSMETSSSSNANTSSGSAGATTKTTNSVLPKVTVNWTTKQPQQCNKNNNNNNNNVFQNKNKNAATTASTASTYSSLDDDEYYSEDEEEEEDQQLMAEQRMAKMLVEGKNSPIPHYLNLWGMKDVDFRVCPEALEVIANQAASQHAGADGVATILEKLLFTVKFELPASEGRHRVKRIDISEDCVRGKEPPCVTFYTEGESCSAEQRRSPSYVGLSPAATGVSQQIRKVSKNLLSDYDSSVMDEMDL